MPENKRGFIPEDIERLQQVSEPQVSPDGRRVAYVVTTVDTAADQYRSHLWLTPLSGGEPRQLTRGAGRDSAPRWSPDGTRLAFVRRRNGEEEAHDTRQIWLIDPEGGEPWQLTTLSHGAGAPAWSPDGTTIAFTSRTRDGEPEKAEKDKTPAEKHAPRVIENLIFRLDGEGIFDERRNHIWLILAAGGDARQVTSGDWNDSDPIWSPDGREIAFTSYREPDRGSRSQWYRDIWILDVGRESVRKLTQSRGPSHQPVWSPDGARIAYAGHQHGDEGARNSHVYSVAAAGGEPVSLTESLDRPVAAQPPMGQAIAWSPNGSQVFFLAQSHGVAQPYAVPASGGEARQIGRIGGMISSMSLTPDGAAIVVAAADPTNPGELYQFDTATGAERRLTHQNQSFLQEVLLNEPEDVTYEGADGWEMHGFLLKPLGYREGERYPLVLEIHGGPHGAHGRAFQPGFHDLSARGYAVLYLNPRGSTGYGEEFCRACVGDWGGKDFEDLMLGVDWAVAAGIADRDRLFVTGYSYGGFMTSWVVGHTDRFKAAVCGAPVSNGFSFYGTSDIGPNFGHFEFGGPPWEQEATFREHSPMTAMSRCVTPVLLLHWEGDLRCPIGQSEEIFAVLRKLGRECVFVRYPGGFHTYVTHAPSQRVDAVRRTGDWFDTHLTAAPESAREREAVPAD